MQVLQGLDLMTNAFNNVLYLCVFNESLTFIGNVVVGIPTEAIEFTAPASTIRLAV